MESEQIKKGLEIIAQWTRLKFRDAVAVKILIDHNDHKNQRSFSTLIIASQQDNQLPSSFQVLMPLPQNNSDSDQTYPD